MKHYSLITDDIDHKIQISWVQCDNVIKLVWILGKWKMEEH